MRISKRTMSLYVTLFTILFIVFAGLSISSWIVNGIIESNQKTTPITVQYAYNKEINPSFSMNQTFNVTNNQLITSIQGNETINVSATFTFITEANSIPGPFSMEYLVNLPEGVYLFLSINNHLAFAMPINQSESNFINLNTFDTYFNANGTNMITACIYNGTCIPSRENLTFYALIHQSYTSEQAILAKNDAFFLTVHGNNFSNITVNLPSGTKSVSVIKFPENKAFLAYTFVNDTILLESTTPVALYQIHFT